MIISRVTRRLIELRNRKIVRGVPHLEVRYADVEGEETKRTKKGTDVNEG